MGLKIFIPVLNCDLIVGKYPKHDWCVSVSNTIFTMPSQLQNYINHSFGHTILVASTHESPAQILLKSWTDWHFMPLTCLRAPSQNLSCEYTSFISHIKPRRWNWVRKHRYNWSYLSELYFCYVLLVFIPRGVALNLSSLAAPKDFVRLRALQLTMWSIKQSRIRS